MHRVELPYRVRGIKLCGQLYDHLSYSTKVKRAGDILKKPDEFESVRTYQLYQMSDDEKTDMIAVVWKELAQWLQQK